MLRRSSCSPSPPSAFFQQQRFPVISTIVVSSSSSRASSTKATATTPTTTTSSPASPTSSSSPTLSAFTPSAKHKIFPPSRPELEIILPPITGGVIVATAKSSRAQCLLCGTNIRSGDHRYGLRLQGAGDYSFPVWLHGHCFEHNVPLVYPAEALVDVSKFNGLSIAPRSAVDLALRVVGRSRLSLSSSSSLISSSSSVSEVEDKLQNFTMVGLLGQSLADEIEAQRLQQLEKQEFFLKLKTPVLQQLMKDNYPDVESRLWKPPSRFIERENLVEFATWSSMFGKVPACTTCNDAASITKKGGKSIFIPASGDAVKMKCSGFLDEFTACTASADKETDLLRSSSSSTKDLFDFSSLNKILSKKKLKDTPAFPKVNPKPKPFISAEKRLANAIEDKFPLVVSTTTKHQQHQIPFAVKPLAGCNFFILDTKNKKQDDGTEQQLQQDATNIILELGGKIVTEAEAETLNREDLLLVHLSERGKRDVSTSEWTKVQYSSVVTLQWLRDCHKEKRRITALESAVLERGENNDNSKANYHFVRNAPDMTMRLRNFDELQRRRAGSNNSDYKKPDTTTTTSSSVSHHHQAQNNSSSSSSEISVVGEYVVDLESGLSNSHKVFVDIEKNYTSNETFWKPYTATLTKTDLGRNKNSVYVVQLLEKHDHQLQNNNNQSPSSSSSSGSKFDSMKDYKYVVWKRWGRVGDSKSNDFTCQVFTNIIAAKKAFEKTFLDRTDNHFIIYNASFVKKPGFYNWIDRPVGKPKSIEQLKKEEAADAAKNKNNNGKGGADNNNNKLARLPAEIRNHPVVAHPPSRDLVARLFDEKVMQESMLTMKIDVSKMPLATLSSDSIKSATEILNELNKVVEEHEKNNKSNNNDSSSSSPSFETKLITLSNQFNSFVPRTCERGHERELIIDSSEKVGDQYQLLSDLSDILLTRQLSSFFAMGAGDPLYSKFQSLQLGDFTPLDLQKAKKRSSSSPASTPSQQDYETEEITNIVNYFYNGQGKTHEKYKLENVWRVSRPSEIDRFKPFESDTSSQKNSTSSSSPRRQLLWHGSRFTNFTRILKDGLLIAPSGVVANGAMFDHGIYSANCQSKAANYCQLYHSSTSNEKGLMMLLEVALGEKPLVLYSSDYNASQKVKGAKDRGCLSVYARGKYTPDPKDDVIDSKHGYKIPTGKLIVHQKPKSVSSMQLLYDELIVYDVSQIKIRYLLEVSQK